jgi:hypothetical protein
MEQLRLDLDDDKQYLEGIMNKTYLGSNSSWYVCCPNGQFYLSIRTHDLGGTDYDYVTKIDYKQARWLVSRGVREHFNCVKNWIR